PLVMDNERAVYESLARKEGLENFKFTERTEKRELTRAAQRREYVVVYYIDPLEANAPALGYDIASNPTRLQAIRHAFNSGKSVVTGRIKLVQETGNQFGVLILHPIYHQGVSLKTLEERHKSRKGVVVEVIRIGDVVETALDSFTDEGIEVFLYDVSGEEEKRFLYFRPSHTSKMAAQPMEEKVIERDLHWSNNFEFAGRHWKILLRPTSSYPGSHQHWYAWIILFGSLLLTATLTFYLFKRLKYTAEIERKIIQEARINQQLAKEVSERERFEGKATRFGYILERSLNEIYVFNADTLKFIQVNKGARNNLGYSMEELQRLTPLDIKTEFTLNSFLNFIEPLRTGERNVILFNTVHKRKDGSIYHVEVHLQFVTFELTPVFVAIALDVTERLRMEEQLLQAQKMESVGTLAGGIAHDFNNLLMGIQGRISLMLMDADSYHPFYEHLKGIEDYVGSASSLTKQLLGFARGGKYEVKPTDLNQLLNKSSEMFGRTKKEIKIHRKSQKDIWTAEVDRSQIEQVLLNLFVNAWQSMPGGGELYLETENIVLDADYVNPYSTEPGKYVKISVTDTGIGMDKDIQERIFDPFFTTREMGRGTGLGLASAYGIIKNHNGMINVFSEKGEGSTFNIYLPALEKEVMDEQRLSEEVLTGKETVLLVDDENMVIDVGKSMLEKMEYKVLIARGGKEAIEIYEKTQKEIGLVILDMIMPEIGGGETYDKLKEINPQIKVLLSSGYSINGQATEILERGCDGFIQKPFSMIDLSQKIRGILDKE
ncbi:MAG: CHASE domain-containing protein, partial [Desulfobacterales bacterium]